MKFRFKGFLSGKTKKSLTLETIDSTSFVSDLPEIFCCKKSQIDCLGTLTSVNQSFSLLRTYKANGVIQFSIPSVAGVGITKTRGNWFQHVLREERSSKLLLKVFKSNVDTKVN